ncbi:crotonase [Novosphingobium endophyticum]|uniref:Crotonase n=1 Tax=Novosphingobium endophyticum TaxID=1955250 RepID=A0A916TUQ2_9SPHN|nr:enoyl-CoA hydratase/isomerase family protein [Novosphingobium endophyticum]GGC00502.1 crotonase [Novosphingobium endophyticum]
MSSDDYLGRFHCIRFEKCGNGVLEMALHTRDGEALWGTSEKSLHAELGAAFLDIARDRDVKVLLLTGTGDSFVAAMDSVEVKPEKDAASAWRRLHEEGTALLENFLAIPVPIISAVNGPALIHAELPVLADIVLAAEHAEFADIAHVPNGVVPGDGVQVVWPMLLGPNRGRYFLLTGERIGAEEAKRLGIVGEVLAKDGLLPRARELAARLAKLPSPTLRYTRMLLNRELRRRMIDELGGGLAYEALALIYPDG